MAIIIQHRNDTAVNWTAVNPILAEGEIGIENDTRLQKVGNGIEAWNDLEYYTYGGASALLPTGGYPTAHSPASPIRVAAPRYWCAVIILFLISSSLSLAACDSSNVLKLRINPLCPHKMRWVKIIFCGSRLILESVMF